MPVHCVAQTGFGTGTNELYDQTRPSYQSTTLSYIRKAVKSTGPLNIVEIGAGTGIFTRALLAHPDWCSSVHQMKVFEPSEGMREVFSRAVNDERVTLHDGTFEETSVENDWADLVVIAQAFHWCLDHERAIAEFARILKPEGVVALIWNLEDRTKAQWVAQLRDRIDRHEPHTPRFRFKLWRQAFDTPSYRKFFQPPEETIWPYPLPGTLETVVNRASTTSYIIALSEDERAKVMEDIKAIVERGEGKLWTEKSRGIFEYPYKTRIVIFHVKPSRQLGGR